MSYRIKRILLTGGGTGGSVMPLLAIYDDLTSQPPLLIRRGEGVRHEFLWIGTKYGPEREMVEKEKIEFKTITGGKLRRYFSLKNFIDPVLIAAGFFQSIFILLKWQPNLVISAGSFVSVPVIWAAWLLGLPIMIHQQDVRPGLANKLMAPLAKVITVTFEHSLKDYGKKAVWTSNPVRLSIVDCRMSNEKNYDKFGLKHDLPVVLVVGGGTGALIINNLVRQSLKELTKFCQIIHIMGKNKRINNQELRIENYHAFEFLDAERIAEVLRLADLVVTRAGMSFLTELSYLGKPTIIIPLPDSPQEDNANIFKAAAVVLKQKELTGEVLIKKIKDILADEKLRDDLSDKIKLVMKAKANENIMKILKMILGA